MADGNVIPKPLQAFDIKQIAHALRITKRSAERRANNDAWAFDLVTGRGGQKRMYPLASLPSDVQAAVRHADAVAAARTASATVNFQTGASLGRRLALAAAIDEGAAHRARETGLAALAGLEGRPRARAIAKMDLLAQAQSFVDRHGQGVCAGYEMFVAAYAAGEIGTPEQRAALGDEISTDSLRRWARTLKSHGAAALAGSYGNRAGSGRIDRDNAINEFAIGLLAEKPHINARHLHQAIWARFGDRLSVSERTVRQWLSSWKSDNRQVFTALANPDQWKNKYMSAQGRSDMDAARINERWEFDGTPSDVMLLDGRANIVGIIDVWSRRAKLHVSKTASSEAVCCAMRRALLDWGVPERAKLDNGTDYVSQRVQRVFSGLQVQVRLSAPFSPWEKPHIERFFHTFSHDLLELLPGYVGHNVAEAQELRARVSFAERLFKKNAAPVEIKMTAAELQQFCDRWIRDVYEMESRNGLDGMTVFQRVASANFEPRRVVDERALDMLMAEAPGSRDGMYRVAKKGLRINGLDYASPELALLVGEHVKVLLTDELGQVVVYHDGAFACVAECPEVMGTSRQEIAIEAKARQKAAVEAKKREIKALGRKAGTKEIAWEILDAKKREREQVAMMPAPNVAHFTPALEAAREAAAALNQAAGQHEAMPAPTLADFAAVRDLVRADQVADETAEQRFARAIRLMAASEVDEFNARWLASYRGSPEFTGRWLMFEEWGGAAFGLGTEFDHLSPVLSNSLEAR